MQVGKEKIESVVQGIFGGFELQGVTSVHKRREWKQEWGEREREKQG